MHVVISMQSCYHESFKTLCVMSVLFVLSLEVLKTQVLITYVVDCVANELVRSNLIAQIY